MRPPPRFRNPLQLKKPSPLIWSSGHPAGWCRLSLAGDWEPHSLLTVCSLKVEKRVLPVYNSTGTARVVNFSHPTREPRLTSEWAIEPSSSAGGHWARGPSVALTWILGFGVLKSVLANPGNFCSSSSKGVSSWVPAEAASSRVRAVCGLTWRRVSGNGGSVCSSSPGKLGSGEAET